MQPSLARSPYVRRLCVASLIVLIPALLLARGSIVHALALPLFILDERLGWHQLIPESWLYPAALNLATVLTLVVAAKWKKATVIVVVLFLINLLAALYFVSVYDGHS